MAAARHDMRDVELVEDDGARGAPGTGVGTARPPHDLPVPAGPRMPPARRGGRRRSVPAVLALVAGLLLGDVTLDARARAGVAELARVPGVVGPLDRPVGELWRGHHALGAGLLVAGDGLVGIVGVRGAAVVVGLDPATGAVVWRTVVRPAGPRGTGGGARCVAPEPSEERSDGSVVCVVDRLAVRDPTGARSGPVAVLPDRLVTLDARTGAVLARRTVEPSTVLAALGPDVVTGHTDRDGYVHVVRADPLTGRVRWRFTAPDPLPRSPLAWTTRLRVQSGVVVVDERDGWALSADGRVLHSWTGIPSTPLEGTAQVLAGGRYLARPETDGGPWPRTRVTDLRTGRSFVVAGRPLPTVPDDGSADDRVLVRAPGTGELVALDGAGRAVWSLPGSGHGRAALLAGRLYRVGPADLSAVDARTGTVLWSTPVARTARTALVTDGRVAVLTRLDPHDGVVLTAYGLVDGRERWTADLADDVAVLTVSGDRLLGWTGEQAVALGPAAR